MNLSSLFETAVERKASDIHLASGEIPRLRISGSLVALPIEPLGFSSLLELLEPALSGEARSRLEAGLTVQRTVFHGDLSFHGVVFRSGDEGLIATFRIISQGVPSLDQIGEGAEELMQRIVALRRGLVLISGPTGSGKWTTACSIVDRINETSPARIFTIEQHPSFRLTSKLGLVSQLRVGQDVESLERACDVLLQADLDVVAVDDIPTIEALRQLLNLADLGHLVVANLHAKDAVDAIRRLLDSAGSEGEALRNALATNLVVATGQRLFLRENGSGRVPAYEWIYVTPGVRRALAAGDLRGLKDLQDADPECRSIGRALDQLVASGGISEATAALWR